jgi:hypothetical protein
MGNIAPRDWGLLGNALQDDRTRRTFPGPLREWAAVSAVVFVLLAVLSWTSSLYFGAFVLAAAVCGGVSAAAHIRREALHTSE